jgi:hypothetical protein
MQRYWERRGEWFLLVGDEYDPLALRCRMKAEVMRPGPGDRRRPRSTSSQTATRRPGAATGSAGWAFSSAAAMTRAPDDRRLGSSDTHPGDNARAEADLDTYYAKFVLSNGPPRVSCTTSSARDAKASTAAIRGCRSAFQRLKASEEYDEAERERNWEASCQVGVVRTEHAGR